MRTRVFIVLLLIGQFLTALDASAFKNEPDGFNEMSWGTPAGSQFSKDDFVGFSSDDKSFKYLKVSDTTTHEIGKVKLYGLVFSLYNGAFWKAELEARLLQAGKLLELFMAKHGEPTRINHVSEFSREYIWSGAVTEIVLSTSLNYYDRSTADIATAAIYSRKIKSQIDADVDRVLTDKKLPIDGIEGFRGMKWGSGFIKGATYLPLEREPFHVYLIKGDDMIFEDVTAREIRYRFYNNHSLQKVDLAFDGKQNFLKVKEACFRLFGPTARYEQGEIRWIGKKTTVSLSFTIDTGGTWLSTLSYYGFGTQ